MPLLCLYDYFPSYNWLQILPDMMKSSSTLFHNVHTAIPAYTNLEPFQKADYKGKVKDVSNITHELRLIKSLAELKLMRESAAIGSQVCTTLCIFISSGNVLSSLFFIIFIYFFNLHWLMLLSTPCLDRLFCRQCFTQRHILMRVFYQQKSSTNAELEVLKEWRKFLLYYWILK